MKYFICVCIICFLHIHFLMGNEIDTFSRGMGDDDYTQYVDPYIGSGAHGHVFVGANVPFGAVQLGPSNISRGWDWCSGYHISDSTIIGFAHTHLSGVGTGDLGDLIFLPITGDVRLKKGVAGDADSGMYSTFSRETEKVKPGYYGVHLDRYNIDVALTATQRVGFHKYVYKGNSVLDPRVVINLVDGIDWDSPTEGYIVQENDSVISGYRFSSGWAKDQRIYFTAIFSEPILRFSVSDTLNIMDKRELKGQNVLGQVYFRPECQKKEKVIYVKVSISPVSIEGAKKNMAKELPNWDFQYIVRQADRAWNKELGKIQITSKDKSFMCSFYTALYHAMIAPSLFCDIDGSYRGTDKLIHQYENFVNYTTFSLWDTYRSWHPLMTIIQADRVPDMINTMLHIYMQQGKLPVWHLMGNETDAMVGNPAIPVVADAYLKGFNGFDKEIAYESMKVSAMCDDRGLKEYKKYGYVPYDVTKESVAKGLEYALADWALAQVAKQRKMWNDYSYFLGRSNSFHYYFDPKTQFMRGIDTNGKYRPEPLNPFKSTHVKNDYTEGNAWQYTWLVPQNVEGLVNLFGGKEQMIMKLDSLFIVNGDLGVNAIPDVSGLIGQYAHGNEPSHHISYLYSYLDQPWKTAERVRDIMYTLYADTPDGLCGNEDVGQMSAWYILSALGFYQVNPAGGIYVFGSPLIDEAWLNLHDNKRFHIKVENNSKQNLYIQSMLLNDTPYMKSYIDYQDIMNGGELIIWMGDVPSTTWGVGVGNCPPTIQ